SYTDLPGFWSDSVRNSYDIDYMVKQFHSGDLEFEPGTEYSYNNTGYFLLAMIIENVTGKSYIENLHDKILEPVQMNNTGIDRNVDIIENKANGYSKQLSGYVNAPYFQMSNGMGAGDMYSTVGDLYLWDQALYSEKLLSDQYKNIMFTPYLNNYGYGWFIDRLTLNGMSDSIDVISHEGGIEGFNTFIFRMVNDKHLIVLLNNTGFTELGRICLLITSILYDVPYELPSLSIAEKIGRTILTEGINIAINQYHDLKTNQKDSYNFSEDELNYLGYQLLDMNKVREAIEIFKLNVTEYPNAFNTYDSLGEAYMINGEKELAIKIYTKSLELNPENTNAISMIKKITEDQK
ncbi:serine hydrolase, partial [Bacteroidota bacterium]